MKKKHLLLPALLLTLFSTASTVKATTIIANFGIGQNIWLKEDGIEIQGWAGALNIALDGTYNRTAFCVDLFTNIFVTQTYGTQIARPGSPELMRAAWLIENEYPALTAAADMAALQLALWDIIHDGGDGLSVGRVQGATTNATDAAILNNASAFLARSLGRASNNAFLYTNLSLTNGAPAQTLMGSAVNDGGPHAPEPSTWAMMAMGAVAVGFGSRRRRQQAPKPTC